MTETTHTPSLNESPTAAPSARKRTTTTVLVGLVALAGLLCWQQHRALRSARDTYQASLDQLSQMRSDATRLLALRDAPQAAVSRTRPNADLLAQVETALSQAHIDSAHWHDSVPLPVQRRSGTDYLRHTTRLYFESITLRQLATFAHHLQSADSALSITDIQLANRNPDDLAFDIQLNIAYEVFAPE
jgi:hypothetical protein